jgi:uncharacterized membrane protein
MSPRWTFAALVLAGLLSACPYDSADEDVEHEEHTPSGAQCPEDSALTYDNFGRDFVTHYCARCHAASVDDAQRQGAPMDSTFDDLASIRDNAELIDHHAASGPDAMNRLMPPSAPLPSDAEREKLGAWLACGAP